MRIRAFAKGYLMVLAMIIAGHGVAIASGPSTAHSNQTASASMSGEPEAAASAQAAGSEIDPQAERIVHRVCATLADARVFTFHAEINFQRVLPVFDVKLQFAGVTDYAVRKPDTMAVDNESDLGAKRF